VNIFPPGFPDEYKPDRPSTYMWMYSPSADHGTRARPPEPHDTYDQPRTTSNSRAAYYLKQASPEREVDR